MPRLARAARACAERQRIGLLSEAGYPAVADPGAELIALAHARGVSGAAGGTFLACCWPWRRRV